MRTLITLLFIILLFSCQKLKYGNVVEMNHEPENEYMMFMPIMCGKNTILMPYYVHDDEDWVIKVTGIGTKGDAITRSFYVTKSKFDSLKIGSFICVDGMCDEDTNNVETEVK